MMEDVFPVEVKLVEREGRLDVVWSDDHVSPFPLVYLRAWCPCAVCQGHFTGEYKYIETKNPRPRQRPARGQLRHEVRLGRRARHGDLRL
jgi:hypothetical protein